MLTQAQLMQLVQHDSGLTIQEKAELIEKIQDNDFYTNLMHGTIGASIGYIISKFLNLSRSAQILMSVAGFGIGRYLLDVSRKHDKFIQYNERLRTYEINS